MKESEALSLFLSFSISQLDPFPSLLSPCGTVRHDVGVVSLKDSNLMDDSFVSVREPSLYNPEASNLGSGTVHFVEVSDPTGARSFFITLKIFKGGMASDNRLMDTGMKDLVSSHVLLSLRNLKIKWRPGRTVESAS